VRLTALPFQLSSILISRRHAVRFELLDGRDLGKKGNRRRQIEYAERTARKAVEQSDA